ncbi:exo-alpha-sialidase [Rhodoferax sp. UBA5149]|uniref:exo-alpha-sialidase n=1 Tax=Rhodoferax sp. UBA5149 TaxID=1947379 RepID=UPI0025ED8F81|nr:sialidase family protein [Rhodoferax sp. UBA5149]
MFSSFVAAVTRSFSVRLLCALLVCAALMGLDAGRRAGVTPLAQAVWPGVENAVAGNPLVPIAHGHIPMPANTPAAHASSLLSMPAVHPSALMAFWFAGTRESAADVQIAASHFDRATQKWSAARFVVNRVAMAEPLGFGVRRLGNPVAWLDSQGRIHLFVVATGLGGWAAARIVHLRQSQERQDFSALSFDVVRTLPLSWLWNTSFLVRTAPLPLRDGGMVLPVHFELGIKYPVALRFDASGEFLGMVRISSRKHLLQPTILMATESHWLALMRDQRPEGKVAVAQTSDSGQHWVDLPDLALDNPDASVAGLALAPGRMFLAHNSSPHSRVTLDLSSSADGRAWVLAQGLAHGAGSDEYSYPALAWADNSLWVSYTDQRQRIAWQRFSFSSSAR